MSASTTADNLEPLREQWLRAWPPALAIWSKFTKLSEPRWCFTTADEKRQGLTGSFAMIRLTDQAVVVSLRGVAENHVEKFAIEILAHEIGHHIYVPGSLLDQGRMLARIRRGLPTKERLAPLIANLYADLLINDRLQRHAGLKLADVYRALGNGSNDPLWTLYMRIYEILWSIPRGTLAPGIHGLPPSREEPAEPSKEKPEKKKEIITAGQLEGDAQLGARLIRSYPQDWLEGSGKFAVLVLPYLTDDGETVRKLLAGMLDIEKAGH